MADLAREYKTLLACLTNAQASYARHEKTIEMLVAAMRDAYGYASSPGHVWPDRSLDVISQQLGVALQKYEAGRRVGLQPLTAAQLREKRNG